MHSIAAWLVAMFATLLLTPVAMRVASRTGFYDRPSGYKGHGRATPYLGGAAIIAGVVIAVLLVGDIGSHNVPIVIGVVAMWAIGTADDRLSLPIILRVATEAGLGLYLASAGLGWSVFHSEIANYALSAFWAVGVMNAFNLMDNMDGACATTAAVSLLGTGALSLVTDRTGIAPVCFAGAGACLGFLPRNLANPAKIFMGDGGSLPLGLLVAAGVMGAVNRSYLGPSGVVIGGLLVGVVIFDTTLVVVSRTRAGRSVFAGGRDHTTHRLVGLLGSPRRVAGTLAGVQLALCGVTVALARAGEGWILVSGGVALAFGIALVWLLETSGMLDIYGQASRGPASQPRSAPVPAPVTAMLGRTEPS